MRYLKMVMVLLIAATCAQYLGCNPGDITDNPPLGDSGVINYDVPRFYVLEGQSAVISVVRESGTFTNATVAYNTADGTAVAGVDYQASNGVLAFDQGAELQTFNVQTLDDNVDKGPRVVNLSLFNPTNAQLGDQPTAELVIFDNDVTLVGLTASQTLLQLSANAPGSPQGEVAITGLNPGEAVLAIDYRPSDAALYGFTNQNRILVLDPVTGAATAPVDMNPTLSGAAFGGDFNPVADRLRAVSNTGQNSRFNVATGVGTADTGLAYAAGDANAGLAPSVAAAAYSNNFPGATTTTLYDIDTAQDVLVIQNPPNEGQLTTVGSLGTDVSDQLGFDISAGGSPFVGNGSLNQIDLETGTLFQEGPLPNGIQLIGLSAIPPGPVQNRIVGLQPGNTLITFAPDAPGTVLSTVAVTGLQAGDQLVGIDYRPAENTLYGMGNQSTLYTINLATGQATLFPPAFVVVGIGFGFDFNPTVDRIRITTTQTDNIRVNPNNGALAAVDTNLAYAAGDPNFGTAPTVCGSAYSNNFPGAATTTLYDIDETTDALVIQNPPNGGLLNTVGPLGFNTDQRVGFDIDVAGTAFASLTPNAGPTSTLFTVNLATGQATAVGTIGGGAPLVGLTVAPAGTP